MTSQNCSNVDAASIGELLTTVQLCHFRSAKDLSHEKQGHHAWCAWCCLYGKSSQLNHQLSGEAGLYLYNRYSWPIISIYFFLDCSAELACWRPWELQSDHSRNFFLSLQFTFNRDKSKSPNWLSIIRHLTSLTNIFKSQAQQLKHLLIYCFDIKSRESQILKTERVPEHSGDRIHPCTEIA